MDFNTKGPIMGGGCFFEEATFCMEPFGSREEKNAQNATFEYDLQSFAGWI